MADATILANYCDGILLVVRAGSTAGEIAQRACQELQGRNVIGVVLNAVEQSHMYGSYYYQGYGYGYVYGRNSGESAVEKPIHSFAVMAVEFNGVCVEGLA